MALSKHFTISSFIDSSNISSSITDMASQCLNMFEFGPTPPNTKAKGGVLFMWSPSKLDKFAW